LKQRDIKRLKKAEMKFVTGTAGYNLMDYRRKQDIQEGIKVEPVDRKLAQYKQKRLNQVSRMEDVRYPKHFLVCQPVGRRRRGRPLKRLLDE
jgi:hypothetical protein